ncbi:MAG: hypothetical protein QOF12_2894 [Solirubrobacteraceae bacterium]|nr:hypothetical protein [Solirubrobacteraceae bacterium]
MSQAQARSWWADVEHLREAAERRQAVEAERRVVAQRAAERRARAGVAPADAQTARARARASGRVRDLAGVDELSARRAVLADERTPRPRRPAPIWLADDAFADPVAAARARAAAPRRTVEIRTDLSVPAPARVPTARVQERPAMVVARRPRQGTGLAASFAARPDRIAFWAFAMGLLLAIVAATSGGHA